MNLVTGATGHIGNVLVRELLDSGEDVRVMVLPGDDLTPLQGLEIEIREGNILDIDSIKRSMQGVDVVYHLAGVISILPGDGELLQRVNVEGTRNMLSAARACKVKRFVYTSSIHALTRLPHGELIQEDAAFNPDHAVGDYDRSKARASIEVLRACRDGLDCVIVCPTGVIGPYDYKESEMGSLISNAIRKNTAYSVDGAYDFVDVRDVAHGAVLAGKYGRCGETYILSGEWIRIRDILCFVKETSGRRGSLIQVPIWLARSVAKVMPVIYRWTKTKPQFTPYSIETVLSNAVVSHSKATQELGYHPRAIKDSLTDTILWLLEYKRMQPVRIHK